MVEQEILASLSRLPWYAQFGRALRRVAWLGVVAAPAIPAFSWQLGIEARTPLLWGAKVLGWALVLLASGYLLNWIGVNLYRRGLSKGSASGTLLLRADPRAPVLYLRSFDDDLRNERAAKLASIVPNPRLEEHAEQLLAEHFVHIGPPVAIGRPGEVLPEIGFARLYAEDGDWQRIVVELIEKASLVLLGAGHSNALMWETEQVFLRAARERVIVLIPFWAQFDIDRYRAEVQVRCGVDLPALRRNDLQAYPLNVRAMVTFAPNGQVQLHECAPHGTPHQHPDWLMRWLQSKNPWFRPAWIDFLGFMARSLGPLFALHGLEIIDPTIEYDQRTRPTAFDRVGSKFADWVLIPFILLGVGAGIVAWIVG